MNSAAGRKDPKAVNQLISLLESGVSPAEAAKRMEEEAEKAAFTGGGGAGRRGGIR